MSAPASEELRELERLLVNAAESGESMELAALQEELGVGSHELQGMLDTLAEHGKAVQDAPGEWRGPLAEDAEPEPPASSEGEDGRVRVQVRDGDEELSGADDGPLPYPAPMGVTIGVPTVRLTVSIANALEAEAIGQLIKAGIAEAAGHDEVFLLEVVP